MNSDWKIKNIKKIIYFYKNAVVRYFFLNFKIKQKNQMYTFDEVKHASMVKNLSVYNI